MSTQPDENTTRLCLWCRIEPTTTGRNICDKCLRMAYDRTTDQLDGNRPLPFDRDQLGRFVREAWVRWARTQAAPKPSWLVPYDELSEADQEADRQIGECIARWTLIGDAARTAESDTKPHGMH